ncbi:MAG: hypothetical protein ABJG47_17615 [Ekhidna sp.]
MKTDGKVFFAIKSSYAAHYLKPIVEQIVHEADQMQTLVRIIEEFSEFAQSKKKDNSTIAKHKSKIHQLIDQIWILPEKKEFFLLYEKLSDSLQEIFDQLDDTHILEQTRDRFYANPEDPITTKVLKSLKWLVFRVRYIPASFLNLFKGEKKKIAYWKHSIPFKNLVIRHFQAETILKLRLITDRFFKELCAQYVKIKNWEKAISNSETSDIDIHLEIEVFLAQLPKEIETSLENILSTCFEEFTDSYKKAGTIELPGRMLSGSHISKFLSLSETRWVENNINWKNTLFSLFEEWRSELDIYTLRSLTLAELEKFTSEQTSKFSDQIDPEIDEIEVFIQDAISYIKKSKKGVGKELSRLHALAGVKLDKELVPRLCNKLSSQKITSLIAKLENSIRQNIEGLSDEHVIVKNNTYDSPIETSELKRVSPYELITFETLGVFETQLEAIKKELFTTLRETTEFASNLDQIVIFSLSSALTALGSEGKTEVEATAVALEGLTRAANRLKDTRNALKSSLVKNSDDLEKAIQEFCAQIVELAVNENVGELRIRITKAKAAKQAEELKKELREKLRVRKRMIFSLFRRSYNQLKARIEKFENRYINTTETQSIDREISDFLLESQSAIQNLPLIYRRLYELEPIEDPELFVGRASEYNMLTTAFTNWEQGKYASTVVVGEKWGGITSFINFTVNKGNYKYPLVRFSPLHSISSKKDLIGLMRIIFKNDSFTGVDHIVDHLKNGIRQIVILENLQNIYLRKIHGFDALNAFFEIISRTHKDIFWVSTSTIYAWDYLCKSINIAEFFSYTIKMENLTEDQIVNIIWKRNRISGFNILFEQDQTISDGKFDKMSLDEQQVFLKKNFFSELNDFAKSNISLALIFWLLSTKKVDKSAITIGTFQHPNPDFLSFLSMEKLHVLHALIIHDGLTGEHLAMVLNSSNVTVRLTLFALLEDGIIVERNQIHMVNPIVFRNIVTLLKAKNLIH